MNKIGTPTDICGAKLYCALLSPRAGRCGAIALPVEAMEIQRGGAHKRSRPITTCLGIPPERRRRSSKQILGAVSLSKIITSVLTRNPDCHLERNAGFVWSAGSCGQHSSLHRSHWRSHIDSQSMPLNDPDSKKAWVARFRSRSMMTAQ